MSWRGGDRLSARTGVSADGQAPSGDRVACGRAVAAEPRNVRIYLALGWCYKRIHRLDLAIETLEEALEIDSNPALNRGILHYNLACYWSSGQQCGADVGPSGAGL